MAQASAQAVWTLKGSPGLTFTDFFALNGAKAQIYPIDTTRETQITGIKGTRLKIAPYSFCNPAGKVITGKVQIHLTEVFFKSEMVLSNKVSTSEDRLLESGGQFHLMAYQENQALKLKTPIEVKLPVNKSLSNPLGMRLFEGSHTITRSFKAKTAFDWRLVVDKSIPIRRENGRKLFNFTIDRFNWYNCDFFYARKSARTMVSAKLSSSQNDFDDQVAFLLFKDVNAVTRMYPNGNRFTSFNIPKKKRATVLVLALKNGQLYYGFTRLNQTSNTMVEVKLLAGSVQNLAALIETM